MKKSVKYLLHLAFWGLNLCFVLFILVVLHQAEVIQKIEAIYYWNLLLGIVLIPGLFSFYLNYHTLFPWFLLKRKLVQSAIYGLTLGLFASFVGMLSLYILLDFDLSCHRQSNFVGIPIMSSIGIGYGVIALIIKGFITWYEGLKEKEALLEKNFEMELSLVKAQLDPHFLFNTINNIDVLILKDPNEASEYLKKLSEIMRFMLYQTRTDRILLSKELDYIDRYIKLQEIRTSNKNYVHYEVKGSPDNRFIAPMVFIPIIENAFKHTNKKYNQAIDITISINTQYLELNCANKYDPSKKSDNQDNGLGNRLIEKRLELLYGDNHDLNKAQSDNIYTVNLKIYDKKN